MNIYISKPVLAACSAEYKTMSFDATILQPGDKVTIGQRDFEEGEEYFGIEVNADCFSSGEARDIADGPGKPGSQDAPHRFWYSGEQEAFMYIALDALDPNQSSTVLVMPERSRPRRVRFLPTPADISNFEDFPEFIVGNTQLAKDELGLGDSVDEDPDQFDDLTEDPNAPEPDDTTADEDDPTCEDNFDFTGAWIVCMALGIVDQTVDTMVNAIADMLQVERAEVNDDGLKTAWSYFRNIASVLLVVIGLVMIIGQAISKE